MPQPPAPRPVPTASAWEGLRAALDAALDEQLAALALPPLRAVMVSAVQGGKRLRGLLSFQCAEAVGGTARAALAPAVAVELIHAASLVVDDLPAMDDAPRRRHRPSTHARYGVAAAELAAHALVAGAFEAVAASDLPDGTKTAAVLELARAMGARGMVRGQYLEGAPAAGEPADPTAVHDLKTAVLFGAAARLGARVGGAGEALVDMIGAWGRQWGRAFQWADDLVDGSVASASRAEARAQLAARREELAASLARLAAVLPRPDRLSAWHEGIARAVAPALEPRASPPADPRRPPPERTASP